MELIKRKKSSILFFLLLLTIYSVFIEPNWLEVTKYTINVSNNPNSSKNITIAHVTDLHTKGLNFLEKKVIEKIKKEKPDVIVITGDIVTPRGTIKGYQDVLAQFSAPKGVFFVPGNWEYWNTQSKLNINSVLKDLSIHNLKNEKIEILSKIWLVGLDDEPTGSPNLEVLEDIPKKDYVIALFHSPGFIEKISTKVNLAFAGHSHGGQVKIPFIKPIWSPLGTGHYFSGWYTIDSAKLYVSRGLGTSILPIRFNSRPELTFITLSY